MGYLLDLGFEESDIQTLKESTKPEVVEQLELFPNIIKINYEALKNVGISNYAEVFLGHSHMFLQNPNRFQAIFDKYDHDDLVRCLEKNASIIEKL